MPRLAKGLVKKVQSADAVSGGFELIKPGRYAAKLRAVTSKPSQAGKPGWNWEFDSITDSDGNKVPGRQFMWTMLPGTKPPVEGADNYEELYKKWETAERLSAGRLKYMFDAFGFSEDSDTDEMLGEPCILQIGVQTIKGGPRKGENQNYIVKLIAFNEDEDFEGVELGDGDDDPEDDEF